MNLSPSYHRLAANPSYPPIYHQVHSLQNGDEIFLSDPDINRAFIACMDMSAVLGGAASHYGGPAAFAEINSVIYGYAFYQAHKQGSAWYDRFHFVNDAGHCENSIYAIKANYQYAGLQFSDLKKFRSIESPLTGHGEAHMFPEGVLVSNGPLGSAVGQAQGLAMADAFSQNWQRTTVLSLSDGGAMEGEAKEALSSIPGLAQKGKLAPFICIVSDNNTKLSGRIDADSFSMQGYLESLSVQGWDLRTIEEGHSLSGLLKSYEKALTDVVKNPQKPILLLCKTIKGIGTEATRNSASGGHGFPLSQAKDLRAFVNEILTQTPMPKEIRHWIEELEAIPAPNSSFNAPEQPSVKKEKIQVGVAAAMIKAREQGWPVVSVSSDLAGSTGVKGFQNRFPEASVDIGIAEANMVSAAAGLSLAGYLPVVDTFAQFGVTKGALPLLMASLSEAPMLAIFSHIGFQDAADGASHQSLSYLAMLNSIPGIDCYVLSCSREAESLVFQALEELQIAKQKKKKVSSKVFFLGRENFPAYYQEDISYQLGHSQCLRQATNDTEKKICLIALGSLIPEALAAAEALQSSGISASVVSPGKLSAICPKLEREILACNQLAICIEEHQAIGGYHGFLASHFVRRGTPVRIEQMAIQSCFGQSAYQAADLYRRHELDHRAIVEKALRLFA